MQDGLIFCANLSNFIYIPKYSSKFFLVLKDILMNRNLLNDSGGNIQFENSLPSKIKLSKELFSYLNEN